MRTEQKTEEIDQKDKRWKCWYKVSDKQVDQVGKYGDEENIKSINYITESLKSYGDQTFSINLNFVGKIQRKNAHYQRTKELAQNQVKRYR